MGLVCCNPTARSGHQFISMPENCTGCPKALNLGFWSSYVFTTFIDDAFPENLIKSSKEHISISLFFMNMHVAVPISLEPLASNSRKNDSFQIIPASLRP